MNLSTYDSNTETKSKARKYITGFLWVLFFLFLFDRSLFYLVSALEAGFYSESQFEHQFAAYVKDKQFSTLILGTSRTYEGIHPFYFEKILGQKAYKESFIGKGPKYNYYFYQLYKKYAGIPRVVIYGVDYFIYSIDSDPRWMARFETKTPKERGGLFSSPLLLLEHKRKIDNFLNNILTRLTEKQDPAQGKEALRDFVQMHEHMGIGTDKEKLVIRAPAKFHRQFYPQGPGKEGKYFRKLLDQLEQDNVTVILVALPDFFGSFKTNFQRNKFIGNLRMLESKYNNIHVYNYNRPSVFPLGDPSLFHDGGFGQTNSHLSRKGAKLLCEILLEDIKGFYR